MTVLTLKILLLIQLIRKNIPISLNFLNLINFYKIHKFNHRFGFEIYKKTLKFRVYSHFTVLEIWTLTVENLNIQ